MSNQARSEAEQLARKQVSSSVLKALDLIEVLAGAKRPLSLNELTKLLHRPASSIHRLLRSLELRGYVENIDSKYRLTLKMFELGTSLVDSIDVVAEARSFCWELCQEVNETVNMGVRSGTAVMYVSKLEAPDSMRLISRLGMHVPLHCTAMGKALLAFIPSKERSQLLDQIRLEPRTPNTIRARAVLEAELEATAVRGWSVDNEEFDHGLICVGAPVWDRSGAIAAAISVTGPAVRLRSRDLSQLGQVVRATGDRISAQLGYRPPVLLSASSAPDLERLPE